MSISSRIMIWLLVTFLNTEKSFVSLKIMLLMSFEWYVSVRMEMILLSTLPSHAWPCNVHLRVYRLSCTARCLHLHWLCAPELNTNWILIASNDRCHNFSASNLPIDFGVPLCKCKVNDLWKKNIAMWRYDCVSLPWPFKQKDKAALLFKADRELAEHCLLNLVSY